MSADSHPASQDKSLQEVPVNSSSEHRIVQGEIPLFEEAGANNELFKEDRGDKWGVDSHEHPSEFAEQTSADKVLQLNQILTKLSVSEGEIGAALKSIVPVPRDETRELEPVKNWEEKMEESKKVNSKVSNVK